MHFLITGTAGFIGFHLARRLLAAGHSVTGIDGLTDYYAVALKEQRHAILGESARFTPHVQMLEDGPALMRVMAAARPDVVVHLAAQAGVRYSLEAPRAYLDANVIGTFNVIEACRAHPVRHLLLASTSSAYGGNTRMPFHETDPAVLPLTIYAASKIATEAMAHAYAHLWGIPTTAFRFFTVYGPWGRPDMALFKFTKAILAGEPIALYNHGRSLRDFTYVDDLVESVLRLVDTVPPAPGQGGDAGEGAEAGEGAAPVPGDSLSPVAPYRLVNIGGGRPVSVIALVEAVEAATGRRAVRELLPMPAGEVEGTHASPDLLRALTGYVPQTPLADGVNAFVRWYRAHYGA